MGNLPVRVSVSMARDYGITVVTYALTTIEPVQLEGTTIATDLLTGQILKQFAHFEEHTLKSVRGAKAEHKSDSMELEATKIVVNMKNGKKLYNVIAGRYQKHGIPFYEEHMKASGINPAEISDEGENLPTGSRAVIEYEDGEPKRVLKIVKR